MLASARPGIRQNATDAGPISDNFNRANSSAGLGTASDGGTWTEQGTQLGFSRVDPVYGIVSNTAYLISGAAETGRARRDLGKTVSDLQVTDARANQNGFSFLWLAYTPDTNAVGAAANDSGYEVRYDSSATITVQRYANGSSTQVGANISVTAWTGGTAVLRATYDGAGTVAVYVNGVLKGSRTDLGTAFTGTWVGFGATQVNSSTGETWDDFSAV